LQDKKYGSGAKERKRAKLTDKKYVSYYRSIHISFITFADRSLNDFSDYNPRGGKFVRREKKDGGSSFRGGGKGGPKKGGNRPGKATRDAKRTGGRK
jgi:hypothetical protein